MKRFLLFILTSAAVFILPFCISASEKISVNSSFSESGVLSFANYLYDKGEYQRAIYELDRISFFYPGNEYAVGVTRLLCQTKLDLEINFPQNTDLKNTGIDPVYSILYIDYMNRNAIDAVGLYSDLNYNIVDKRTEKIYYRRIFLNRLVQNDFKGAKTVISGHDLGFDDFTEIQNMYDKFKSPYIGMFAGIFPGGGYMYAGNARTGITALTVIGIFFTASYFAHVYESDYIAAASGTVGGLFYGGSILGGYMESVRYNKNLKQQIYRYIEYNYGYESDREYLFKTYGTGGLKAAF